MEKSEISELALSSEGSLELSIEVHNGEDNGSHVIIWLGDELTGEPTEVLDGYYGTGTNIGINFEDVNLAGFEIGPAEALDE